ncbi:HNH endonuclease [Streptomyces sp. NA04227]|uniref:HNH endonuclease n=1 Tax=Streptomyces sp. NA04227 TaxID=2742136 RepID=UPI0020CA726F|nr:HNH endonuclease [Streptomyces sp. NA04227]
MRALSEALRASIGSGELHLIPSQPDEREEEPGATAREGRLLTRLALYRERDPRLRRRKLEQIRRLRAAFRCEVCEFDFAQAFGALGAGYIEVHHVTPLHIAGPSETHLHDLALLCANCHRMCHRSFNGESWRTPAALRALIATAGQNPHAAPVSAS